MTRTEMIETLTHALASWTNNSEYGVTFPKDQLYKMLEVLEALRSEEALDEPRQFMCAQTGQVFYIRLSDLKNSFAASPKASERYLGVEVRRTPEGKLVAANPAEQQLLEDQHRLVSGDTKAEGASSNPDLYYTHPGIRAMEEDYNKRMRRGSKGSADQE